LPHNYIGEVEWGWLEGSCVVTVLTTHTHTHMHTHIHTRTHTYTHVHSKPTKRL